MQTSASRCPSRVLRAGSFALVLVMGAASLPLAGCKGGSLGGLLSTPSAMELLTPAVKEAANTYVSSVSSLANSLSKLNDLQGVVDFVNKAQPLVKQARSSYETLSGTTGDERANLIKAFGPKLDSTNSSFLGQADRVKSNGLWGKALSPVLDNVKLFR